MEEKKLILELLKNGKIDTEQAILLLDAIKGENTDRRNFDFKKQRAEKQFENDLRKFTKTVEKFSNNLGDKVKDAEPVLKDTSKKVMDKTAQLLNDLATKFDNSLNNTSDFDMEENIKEAVNTATDNLNEFKEEVSGKVDEFLSNDNNEDNK